MQNLDLKKYDMIAKWGLFGGDQWEWEKGQGDYG
jgi:hypothetical protein